MAEEQQVIPLDTSKESELEVAEKQYSDDEVKAMDHGWVPKDKWEGNADEWVPAKVFNIRGELFGRIAKDKALIGELKQSVDALVEHNKKLFDAGYKRAITDLKEQKRTALEEGDTDAVMKLDDKIEEVKEQAVKAKEEFNRKLTPAKEPVNPDFPSWHEDNEWYMSDTPLTAYADGIAQEMLESAKKTGKNIEWPKFYGEISRKVRQKFPEKFETRSRSNMSRQEVETVEDSTSHRSTTASGSSLKESDLTEDQRRIMNNILKTTKSLTKKEYLEQMSLFEKRKGTR